MEKIIPILTSVGLTIENIYKDNTVVVFKIFYYLQVNLIIISHVIVLNFLTTKSINLNCLLLISLLIISFNVLLMYTCDMMMVMVAAIIYYLPKNSKNSQHWKLSNLHTFNFPSSFCEVRIILLISGWGNWDSTKRKIGSQKMIDSRLRLSHINKLYVWV